MRTTLVKLVTFIAGLYFFLEFLLPEFVLEKIGVSTAHEHISQGVVLVGVMAVGLGIINLFTVHGSRIAFRRKGWFNSVALLLGLIVMMTVAILDWRGSNAVERRGAQLNMLVEFAKRIQSDRVENVAGVPPAERRIMLLLQEAQEEHEDVRRSLQDDFSPEQLNHFQNPKVNNYVAELEASSNVLAETLVVAKGDTSDEILTQLARNLSDVSVALRQLHLEVYSASIVKSLWNVLFDGLFVALGSAMFSLLGVYIASAAYRAFRVRSFESALMMVAAVLVMLGQIPFGIWLYADMPDIRLWLLQYPNSAAFRAIKIGASVAGLVMAFRMWLSLESDYSAAPNGGSQK